MSKVYVVTTGDYSDYHIVAVCSTEENAEDVRKTFGADSVEEWDLDKFGPGKLYYFIVDIRDNNYIDVQAREDDSYWNLNEIKRDETKYYKRYSVMVRARDREHAIKIASDLIAQYKASK